MTPAERQKRHRERAKDGKIVVPVELSVEAVEMLVQRGLIGRDETEDREKIGTVLSTLTFTLSDTPE